MFGVGHFWEILILLVIVLLVFGPGKLPEVGSALGRGIREFKDATNNLNPMNSTPPPPTNYQQPTNYQPPMISQTPPQAPPMVHQPQQQWQAPVAAAPEPITADTKSGDR